MSLLETFFLYFHHLHWFTAHEMILNLDLSQAQSASGPFSVTKLGVFVRKQHGGEVCSSPGFRDEFMNPVDFGGGLSKVPGEREPGSRPSIQTAKDVNPLPNIYRETKESSLTLVSGAWANMENPSKMYSWSSYSMTVGRSV